MSATPATDPAPRQASRADPAVEAAPATLPPARAAEAPAAALVAAAADEPDARASARPTPVVVADPADDPADGTEEYPNAVAAPALPPVARASALPAPIVVAAAVDAPLADAVLRPTPVVVADPLEAPDASAAARPTPDVVALPALAPLARCSARPTADVDADPVDEPAPLDAPTTTNKRRRRRRNGIGGPSARTIVPLTVQFLPAGPQSRVSVASQQGVHRCRFASRTGATCSRSARSSSSVSAASQILTAAIWDSLGSENVELPIDIVEGVKLALVVFVALEIVPSPSDRYPMRLLDADETRPNQYHSFRL